MGPRGLFVLSPEFPLLAGKFPLSTKKFPTFLQIFDYCICKYQKLCLPLPSKDNNNAQFNTL